MTEKPSEPATIDSVVASDESIESTPAPDDSADLAHLRPDNKPWLVWILFVLLVTAVLVAFWYQRQAFDRLTQNMASRVADVSASVEMAKRDTDQALALARSQAATISSLQTSLAEARSQYQALQEAWSRFGHDADATVLLNDIEQLLTQAQQQLRLGGNVGNAIIALDIAQTRLAHAERPEWQALQQSVAADLEALRAVPMVNVPSLSARVDQLIALVANAPLLASDAAVVTQPEPSPLATPSSSRSALQEYADDATWWQQFRDEIGSWPERALSSLSREASQLISIRRVEDPNVLLLAPDQAEQLRATLRMRLLTAKLALLMRQTDVWQSELVVVSATLASNYDARSVDTMTAVQIARELSEAEVTVTLPDLGASLQVVTSLRVAGDVASPGKE